MDVGQRLIPDTRNDLHWGEPTSARERWSAAAYIASTTLVVALVVLAVVFDQFAATGVLLVAFLSFILTYLIAPASEWLRHTSRSRRGRPLSRVLTTLVIYGIIAAVLFPVWAFNGAADRRGAGAGAGPRPPAHRPLRRPAARHRRLARDARIAADREGLDRRHHPSRDAQRRDRGSRARGRTRGNQGARAVALDGPGGGLPAAHAVASLSAIDVASVADAAPAMARRRVPAQPRQAARRVHAGPGALGRHRRQHLLGRLRGTRPALSRHPGPCRRTAGDGAAGRSPRRRRRRHRGRARTVSSGSCCSWRRCGCCRTT